MSTRTDAAAALITERNQLAAMARDLTGSAAALIAAENEPEPPAGT